MERRNFAEVLRSARIDIKKNIAEYTLYFMKIYMKIVILLNLYMIYAVKTSEHFRDAEPVFLWMILMKHMGSVLKKRRKTLI